MDGGGGEFKDPYARIKVLKTVIQTIEGLL